MATTEGPTDEGPPTDKGQPPPPPSPLSGAYLLIIVGEPYSDAHKEDILRKIANGLQSWDVESCHVSLEKELQAIIAQAPEGEEARNGERLIQFASENLVTEVLIQPQLNTLIQCIRNLLSSFTRHRHLIHAGYTFAGNGSWIVQDGTFSLADLIDAFQETDVQRVLRAYENSVSVDIHCAPEGDWSTARLRRESFSKLCRVRVNPDDSLSPATNIQQFIDYLSPFVRPASVEQLLEPSDVVGNIRFSHPTLYVFPGGQGDAALFGINGFNMLVDGGFARKACFWDFVRHLDRLDAVLMTRLNNSNCNGLAAVLRRKRITHVYPQIGHFFCNLQERRNSITPDTDKVRDSLIINLFDEGHEIVDNLRHLQLKPHNCFRDSVVEPINLYHKVGHGKLDMYVLSPSKDSRELKEFLSKWNANDQSLFTGASSKKPGDKEFCFPIQNVVSICALLVWQPANPSDTITRILFPGSAPQNKIFEGLERLRHLEFMKHPVCSAKTLSPSSSSLGINAKLVSSKPKSTPAVIDKLLPGEGVHKALPKSTPSVESVNRQNIAKTATIPVSGTTETKHKPTTAAPTPAKPPQQPKPKVEKTKAEIIPTKTEIDKNIENEAEISKPEKPSPIIDTGKPKTEKLKQEVKHRRAEAKNISKMSAEKRPTTKPTTALDKKGGDSVKSSPTTPKKIVESKVNGVLSKAETAKVLAKSSMKMKASPSATPAKSAKEENNRKVVESKAKAATKPSAKPAKREEPTKPAKAERKPKKPLTSSPSKVIAKPGSPIKTVLKAAKTKKETKKIKGETEKGVVTDSSTVSTPSTVDAEMTMIKEGKLEDKITEEIKQDEKIIEEDVTLKEKKLEEAEKHEGDSSKDIDESAERKESLSVAEEEKFVKENGVDIEATETKPAAGVEKEKEVSDKDEEDEILIIEKVEVEQYGEDSIQEQESIESHFPEEAEDELQKHLRDEAESEKKMKDIEGDKDEVQDKEGEEKEIIEKEDTMEKVTEIAKEVKGEVKEKEEKEVSDEEKEIKVAEESEKLTPESKEKLVEEVQEIITSATEYISKTKVEVGKDSSELSAEGIGSDEQKLGETKDISSPEKAHLVSDKHLVESIEDEQKEDDTKDKSKELIEKYGAEESQPDERFSTTVESGATTAPTLPEDERIPLDEIKEGIEEKHVKEETKEKDIFAAAKPEQPTSLPQVAVIGGPFETRGQLLARDIVKTPDEVADLPVHEEVDGIYEGDEFGSREFSKSKDDLLGVTAVKKEREIKDVTKDKLKPEKEDIIDVTKETKEVGKDVEEKVKEIEEKVSIVEHIKTEEDELKELKMIRQKLEEADNGFQLPKPGEKIEKAEDSKDIQMSKKEERDTEEKEISEEVKDLNKQKEAVPEVAEKLTDSRESPDRNERDSYELYTDSGVEEEPVHGVLKGAEVAEYVLVTPDSTPESPLRYEDKKLPDIAKLSEEVETKIVESQKKVDESVKSEDKQDKKDFDVLKDKKLAEDISVKTMIENELLKEAKETEKQEIIGGKELVKQDESVSKVSPDEIKPIQEADEKLAKEIVEEVKVSKPEETTSAEKVKIKAEDDLKPSIEKFIAKEKEQELKEDETSQLRGDESKPEEQEKKPPTTTSPTPASKDEIPVLQDKEEEKEIVPSPLPPLKAKLEEERAEILDKAEKEKVSSAVIPFQEIEVQPITTEKDDKVEKEESVSPTPLPQEGEYKKEEEKSISPAPEKPTSIMPPHKEEFKPITDEKEEKDLIISPGLSLKETESKEEPRKLEIIEKEKSVSPEPSAKEAQAGDAGKDVIHEKQKTISPEPPIKDDTKQHVIEEVKPEKTEKEETAVVSELTLKEVTIQPEKIEKEEKIEIQEKDKSVSHTDKIEDKEKAFSPESSIEKEAKPSTLEKEEETKVHEKVEEYDKEETTSTEPRDETKEKEPVPVVKHETKPALETLEDVKITPVTEDKHDKLKPTEHKKDEKEKEVIPTEEIKVASMPPESEKEKSVIPTPLPTDEKSDEKRIEKDSVGEALTHEEETKSLVPGKEEEKVPDSVKDVKEASVSSEPPFEDVSEITKEDLKSVSPTISFTDKGEDITSSLAKKDEKEKIGSPAPSLKDDTKTSAAEKEEEKTISLHKEVDFIPIKPEKDERSWSASPSPALFPEDTKPYLPDKEDTQMSVSPTPSLKDEDVKPHETKEHDKEKRVSLTPSLKDKVEADEKEKSVSPVPLLSDQDEVKTGVPAKEEKETITAVAPAGEPTKPSIPDKDEKEKVVSPTPSLKDEVKPEKEVSISSTPSLDSKPVEDKQDIATPALSLKEEEAKTSVPSEEEKEQLVSSTPTLKEDTESSLLQRDEKEKTVSPVPSLKEEEEEIKHMSPTFKEKEEIKAPSSVDNEKEKSVIPTPSIKDDEKFTVVDRDIKEKSQSPTPALKEEDIKTAFITKDEKERSISPVSSVESEIKEKSPSPTLAFKEEDIKTTVTAKDEKERSISPAPSLESEIKEKSPTPAFKEEEIKTTVITKDEKEKSISPAPSVESEIKETSPSPIPALKEEDIKTSLTAKDDKESSISSVPTVKYEIKEKSPSPTPALKEEDVKTTVIAKDEKERSISPAPSVESDKSSIGKDETKKSVSPSPSLTEEEQKPSVPDMDSKERSVSPASSIVEEIKTSLLQKEEKDKSGSPTSSLKDEAVKHIEPTKDDRESSDSPVPPLKEQTKQTTALDERDKSISPIPSLREEEIKPSVTLRDEREKSASPTPPSKDESKASLEKDQKEKTVSPTPSLIEEETKTSLTEKDKIEKSVSPTPSLKEEPKLPEQVKEDKEKHTSPTPSSADEEKPSVQESKDTLLQPQLKEDIQQLNLEKDEKEKDKISPTPSLLKEDSEPQILEKEVKDSVPKEDTLKETTKEETVTLEEMPTKEKSESCEATLSDHNISAVTEPAKDISFEETLTLESKEIAYTAVKDEKDSIRLKDTVIEKDISDIKTKEVETHKLQLTAKLEKDKSDHTLETTTNAKELLKDDIIDSTGISKQEVDTSKTESLKLFEISEQKDLSNKDETASFKSVSPAPSSEDSLEKFEQSVTEESKLTGTLHSISPDHIQNFDKSDLPKSISPSLPEKDATKTFLSMESTQVVAQRETTEIPSKEIDIEHLPTESVDLPQSVSPKESGKDDKTKQVEGIIPIPQEKEQKLSSDKIDDTQKIPSTDVLEKESEGKQVSSEISESPKSLSPISSRKDSDFKMATTEKTDTSKCTSPLPSEKTSDMKFPLSDKDGSQIQSVKDSEIKPQTSERDDSLTSITSLPSEKDSEMKSVLSEKSDLSKSEAQKDSHIKLEPSDKTVSPKSISPFPFEKEADLKTIASGKLSPEISVSSDKKSETETTASVKDDKYIESGSAALDKGESPKRISPVLSDTVSEIESKADLDKHDSTSKSVSPVPSRKDSDSKPTSSLDKDDTPKSVSPVPFDKETQIKTITSDKEELLKSVSSVPSHEDQHAEKLETADKYDTSKSSSLVPPGKETDLKPDKDKDVQKPTSPVPSEKESEIKQILSDKDKVPSKSVSPVPSEKETEIKSSAVTGDDTPKSVSPIPSRRDSDMKSSFSSEKYDTPKCGSPAPPHGKESEFQSISADKDEKLKTDSPVSQRKDSDVKPPSLGKGDTPKSISPTPSDAVKDETPKRVSPVPSQKEISSTDSVEDVKHKVLSKSDESKDTVSAATETASTKTHKESKQKTEIFEELHSYTDQKISETVSEEVFESKEIKSSLDTTKDVKGITKEFLDHELKTTEESTHITTTDEKPLFATSKMVMSTVDGKTVDVSEVFTESESTEISKQVVEKLETSDLTDTVKSQIVKTEKTEEKSILHKKEIESSSSEETSSVRRMVVTASSEDGGLETELCSGDNITFMATKHEDQSQSDKDISEASVSSTISFSATSEKSSALDSMKTAEIKTVTTAKSDVIKDSTLPADVSPIVKHSQEVSEPSMIKEKTVTSASSHISESDIIHSSEDPLKSAKTTVKTIVTTKTYGKDGTESITTTIKETSETGDVKYSTYSKHETPVTESKSGVDVTSTTKKDENGIKSTEIKTVKVIKTSEDIPLSAVSVIKRELSETGRSATPASDVTSEREFDLGGPSTPHSDISSSQASRAATNVWGESSEGRPDSRHCESDDDIPCSPMSTTSHVAHSPPQFDFEMHRASEESYYDDGAKIKEVKMATAMTSSFYGSLPEEDPLEQLMQEKKEKHVKTDEASAMYSSMYVSKYDDDDNDQGDEYLYGNGKGKFEAMFASGSVKSADIDFETAMKEHRSARGEDIAKVTNGSKETSVNGKSGLNGDSRGFYREVYTNGKHVLEEKLNGKSSYSESSEFKSTLSGSSSVLPTKTISGQAVYPEPSTGFSHSTSSKTADDKKGDPIEGWGKPLGLPPPPKRILNSPTSSESQFTLVWNPVEEWGIPLGLPSPAPPPPKKDSAGEIETDLTPTSNKTTPKKMAKKNIENNKTASNTITGREANNRSKRPDSPNKRNSNKDVRNTKQVTPVYMDLTYVPHHGNSHYTSVEFFKRVRARYYVFSGTEPSREVFNALLEAKQTWEDKDLEVTIIPTYDTDTLGYWVAENEEILAKYKIDLSPSASRCTINLQDHETSCSAYRLEF